MIINALFSVPFGIIANSSIRKTGKLSVGLALRPDVAMHGHAALTFAESCLDQGLL